MIRIGLIGSENSHSMAYAKLLNLKDTPNRVRGAKIVAMWGEPGQDDHTQDVAQKGAIPEIVAKPADLIGKVDAAICTCRDGAVHAKYSLPVIEAGVPTFVDKPFAATPADARKMIRAAEKAGGPITSFSSIRLSTDVAKFIKDSRSAEIFAGVSTGPADIASPYSGLDELVAKSPGYHIAAKGKVYSDDCPLEELKNLRRRLQREFYNTSQCIRLARKGLANGLGRFWPVLFRLPLITWKSVLNRRKKAKRHARRKANMQRLAQEKN